MSTLSLVPAAFNYSSLTDELLEMDLTTATASVGGTGVTSPTCAIVDISTGVAVANPPSVTVTGTMTVTVQVNAVALGLVGGNQYRIIVTWTGTGTTNKVSNYAIMTMDY